MAEMISKVSSVITLCEQIQSLISHVRQTLYNNQGQECETLCQELRIMEQIHIDLRNRINSNTDSRNSERGLLGAIQYTQTILQKLLTAVSGPRLKKYQVIRRCKLRKTIDEKTKSLHQAREMVTHALECSRYRPSNQSSSDAAGNTVNNITFRFEYTVTDGSGRETDESEGSGSETDESEGSGSETDESEGSGSETDESEGSGSETDESEGHETTDNEINKREEETNEPPTFQEISGIIQPHDVITFKNQIFILMDGGIYAYNMAGNTIKHWGENGFKPFAATFLGNTLFVTDKKSKCVIKFDESLNVKQRFGRDNMEEPAGITSCERGKCIFVLTGKKRESAVVAKYTSDGEYIRCYCSDSLEDPWYIKKSSSNEFFISDFARMAVDVYSYDFSNRLYTVNTYKHCRGMDIDDEGHIYVATRSPGYKARYECIVRYIEPRQNKCVMLEESPKPWFWQNQNKSLDFVRGLHYYRCQDKKFLMVVDAGNKRLKVIPL
ncbi:uncharacterized protein [Apostichopus japonicus]|uniref:uncharacterized protein n=1 Tax=Stichopus japonicus TaxID=307972 RepID=UPI003AB5E2DA